MHGCGREIYSWAVKSVITKDYARYKALKAEIDSLKKANPEIVPGAAAVKANTPAPAADAAPKAATSPPQSSAEIWKKMEAMTDAEGRASNEDEYSKLAGKYLEAKNAEAIAEKKAYLDKAIGTQTGWNDWAHLKKDMAAGIVPTLNPDASQFHKAIAEAITQSGFKYWNPATGQTFDPLAIDLEESPEPSKGGKSITAKATRIAKVNREHFDGVVKGMSKDEVAAFKYYTGDGYSYINEGLRGKSTLTDADKVKADLISSAINRAGNLPQPMTVWRGVGEFAAKGVLSHLEDMYARGATFQAKGFVSTSVRPSQAMGFGSNLILKITAKTGVYVDKLSKFESEREILQNHGTRYRIKSVTREQEIKAISETTKAEFSQRVTLVELEEI